MKIHEKATDWIGLVLDLGKANDMYLTAEKLNNILFHANEMMKKMTGMALFKEEPFYGPEAAWVVYDSIKRKTCTVGGICPITCYESCTFDVDLIQVNVIRKAMKLPLVHVDDF